MKKGTTLIIADDHNVVSKLLEKSFISKGYKVVGTAKNGKEVLQLLKNHVVDVILMDYKMPFMDGIEATHIISKDYPNVKVLMLSMFGKPACIEGALSAGAKGYMCKESDPEEIEFAIKEVLNGNLYISPDIAHDFWKFNKDGKMNKLSRLEREILSLLSLGLNSKQIEKELKLSFYTVNNYRKNMMIKFGANNVTSLLAITRELGYIK